MTPRRRAAIAAPEERRARILEAAVAEFVARGYEAASTNAIAAGAGVAKGLAFHYFGSKEALFVAAYRHVLDRTVAAMTLDPPMPADLFERLHAISCRKLEAFRRDPLAFQLVAIAHTEAPASSRDELARVEAALSARHLDGVLEGVDTSRLRPGLGLADAMATLSALAEGVGQRLLRELAARPDRGAAELERMRAELWAHFVRLRDGLYG